MSNRLFVGNLPYDATEDELRQHFSQAGSVSSVFIPLDRETGRPRGFAFVEFEDPEHATAAIDRLHQKPFRDRPLVVNEARPNESRPSGPRSGSGPRPSGPRPSGFSRPPSMSRGPMAPPSGGFGEEDRDRPATRRAPGPKPRRRPGKRGGNWDEGPRKEPIPEVRRGQIFDGYDDVEEGEEDLDFENFALGLPDEDQNEDDDS